MSDHIDRAFIQHINKNLAIAHKVARIYFPDKDDREDAIQEMMYQLWRSYAGFEGLSKFSTWMYRVCLNTALTYRKKINKDKKETIRLAHHQIEDQTPTIQDENMELLFEAIATLTPLNKAITLLYLESMSYEEIAEVIGVTKTNVSVRLFRIKKELESKLIVDKKRN